MKILLATGILPDPEGTNGGALVRHALLAGLAERHEVTVATLAGPNPDDRAGVDQLRARHPQLRVHAVWQDAPAGLSRWTRRVRLATGWLRQTVPLHTLELRVAAMQRLLDHLLATERYDLVQVEGNAMAQYRLRTAAPRVLTEHEVLVPERSMRQARPASPIHGALRRADASRLVPYQAWAWRRFARIQVFTREDAASLLRIAPDLASRVVVNPFGVAIPPGVEGSSQPTAATVLFIGSFIHPPNVEAAQWLVRDVLPLLHRSQIRPHVVIVGPEPPPSVLALAADGVEVTGRVPHVAPYLERAAVVVAPLLSGGGMRVKVLEAMAYSRPLVATSRAVAGLGGPDGIPVRIADTAGAFAEAVAALLRDPGGRERLGAEARTFVATHYSNAAFVRRTEEMYASLISGH